MRSALNVLNFEVKKPNLSKLAYKHSAKVIISNFIQLSHQRISVRFHNKMYFNKPNLQFLQDM
ncbi:MAG: hypothetical protein CL912_14575 [Deltaproteobacteria bacterium]|nr:hypothetical protein [Deltaproteobacteria bacterium]